MKIIFMETTSSVLVLVLLSARLQPLRHPLALFGEDNVYTHINISRTIGSSVSSHHLLYANRIEPREVVPGMRSAHIPFFVNISINIRTGTSFTCVYWHSRNKAITIFDLASLFPGCGRASTWSCFLPPPSTLC